MKPNQLANTLPKANSLRFKHQIKSDQKPKSDQSQTKLDQN